MKKLAKKIINLEPTKEQLKDRTPEYAFGWVDCLNAVTNVVKNYDDLHSVSQKRELLKAFLEHIEETVDFLPCEPSVLIDDYLNNL